MKKLYLLIIFIIILGAYLYCSYVFIYKKIDWAGLRSPDSQKIYLINNNMQSGKNLIYVALGDSLTAGVGADKYEQSFTYLLAQKIAGDNQITLKDYGLPGAKTDDLIEKLLNSAITDQPDILTLLIGVNDVHYRVGKDEFQKNYDEILRQLTAKTKAKIYLINIPYIGANDLILPPYDSYFESRAQEFNVVIKELAEKYQLKYIDLYTPTVDQFKKNGPHYSADSFHPSAEGYAVWAQIIYDQINQ
ncbi:MAG: SGNH/GDSL hydrolase family protein [Patescibacteria group bacterium]|nr:SGNH/GDSL hydrolase family protein [Patescibacteria group bacterium]MDD4610356.1 SGNH/GDSL hydrolase family protein [Patescibacteria group bacterium]